MKAGTVRALALSGETRLKAHPEIPTFAEAGLVDASSSDWWGIEAPAGTLARRLTSENASLWPSTHRGAPDPAMRRPDEDRTAVTAMQQPFVLRVDGTGRPPPVHPIVEARLPIRSWPMISRCAAP